MAPHVLKLKSHHGANLVINGCAQSRHDIVFRDQLWWWSKVKHTFSLKYTNHSLLFQVALMKSWGQAFHELETPRGASGGQVSHQQTFISCQK